MPPAFASTVTLMDFIPIEGRLVRKQADILTFRPDVRVNRLEVAKRLRDEVLIPWREASKPILQSATISAEDPSAAQLQSGVARVPARPRTCRRSARPGAADRRRVG